MHHPAHPIAGRLSALFSFLWCCQYLGWIFPATTNSSFLSLSFRRLTNNKAWKYSMSSTLPNIQVSGYSFVHTYSLVNNPPSQVKVIWLRSSRHSTCRTCSTKFKNARLTQTRITEFQRNRYPLYDKMAALRGHVPARCGRAIEPLPRSAAREPHLGK